MVGKAISEEVLELPICCSVPLVYKSQNQKAAISLYYFLLSRFKRTGEMRFKVTMNYDDDDNFSEEIQKLRSCSYEYKSNGPEGRYFGSW